jgi:hypothetical protein
MLLAVSAFEISSLQFVFRFSQVRVELYDAEFKIVMDGVVVVIGIIFEASA